MSYKEMAKSFENKFKPKKKKKKKGKSVASKLKKLGMDIFKIKPKKPKSYFPSMQPMIKR
jgi:hypothetical protein